MPKKKPSELFKNAPSEVVKFARAPYAGEVITKEYSDKFNSLPGSVRHLIKRLIDTDGDFGRASIDSGFLDPVSKNFVVDASEKTNVESALTSEGITRHLLCQKLKECLEGRELKPDGKGNVMECQNRAIQLKAIELCFKLLGDTKGDGKKETSLSDIDRLFPES